TGTEVVSLRHLPVRDAFMEVCHRFSLVTEHRTHASGTSSHEQPELPVADLAPQECQHHQRVGAAVPLGLGHGFALRTPVYQARRAVFQVGGAELLFGWVVYT